MNDCCVIAVDGPAGSGKSSAARGVARALGLRFLDTGATYRALTWWLLHHGLATGDAAVVAAHAKSPAIEVVTDPVAPGITVDGADVSVAIRTREVSNAVSEVAAVPEVRAHLIAMQRGIIARTCASGDGIVADGRDIGTVVAPSAPLKIFLTASEEVRAGRRRADAAAGPAASHEVTRRELGRRDRIDAPQSALAPDAVVVDSTALTLDEVISLIVGLARERGMPVGRPGGGGGPAGSPQPADAAWSG